MNENWKTGGEKIAEANQSGETALTQKKTVARLLEIETWLATWMTKRLGISIEEIESDQAFVYYGMDSVAALELAGDVEENFKISISDTAAWSHPNIRRLAGLVIEFESAKNLSPACNSALVDEAPSVDNGLENRI